MIAFDPLVSFPVSKLILSLFSFSALQMFQERVNVSDDTSYAMQNWLEKFVSTVGHAKAIDLLKGAGEFGDWKHPDEGVHWTGT